MNLPKFYIFHSRLQGLAMAAALLAILGVTNARAQYTVVGTTSGGGNIIIGNGSLGPLGPSTPLSAGGFDNVTLNIGSTATATTQDTITFATSNNTLLNNGNVVGGAGSGANGFNAISFTAASLTGETVTNNGAAIGGAGIGSHHNGGAGIILSSANTISNITITNAGSATGGLGGGSASIGNGGYAIYVTAGGIMNNVVLNNTGNVTGGIGPEFGGQGIEIDSGSSMSNISLVNSGNVAGGATTRVGVGQGGWGILISSLDSLTNLMLQNSGTVTGGNSFVQGKTAISVQAGTNLSNVVLVNSGNATGGIGTGNPSQPSGARGGDGIDFFANNAMSNVEVINAGAVAGGSGFGSGTTGVARSGGKGNAGVSFSDSTASVGGLNNVSLTNFNSIQGGVGIGNGGAGSSGVPGANAGSGGVGGPGVVYALVSGASNGITLNNNGSIIGGAGIGNGGAGGNASSLSNSGGNGGNGAMGGAGLEFNFFPDPFFGTANGVLVGNNGSITGGAGFGNGGDGGIGNNGALGGNGGVGGNGIEFLFGQGCMTSDVTLINNGSITGGAGLGNGGNGDNSVINGQGGNGGMGGNGVAFLVNGGTASNISVVNFGMITGGAGAGNGGAASFVNNGGAGGNGIAFINSGSGSLSGATVTNFNQITGGNGNGGVAGAGISASTGNVTVNNWGAISAGAGASTATQSGFPAVAISLAGDNYTINLNGHSSVNGTIQASGNNNVLNLNFTGMSPAAIQNLMAQLTAQGWPGSNNFTGTFTVRNVTYFVDPITLTLNLTSYQLQGVTPNQQAIGASLDSATTNPAPGTPLFTLFNAIDASGNVPLALDALSPQKYAIYGDLAIQNSSALVQEIDQRLDNLRDGSENVDTTGVGVTAGEITAGFSKESDNKESKEVVQPAAPEKRWGFFATGNGLFFRGNAGNGQLQQGSANTAGTTAGVDAKIGEHMVAGALFAYDNANVKLGADGSAANIDSYTGGIYAGWHDGGFYANSLLAYTYNHYDSSRDIVFPGFNSVAGATTHGNQYTADLDGGYDWHLTERFSAGPLGGVQYVHLDVNGFNESGSPGALAVGSEKMDSLLSRVGLHANYHVRANENVAFAADLRAAWQHEYLNDSRAIGASFTAAPLTPFNIQTASPLRDAGDIGIGLNVTFKDRLTLFANYDLILWNASYFEQSVNGGFRLSF